MEILEFLCVYAQKRKNRT